LGVTQAAAFRRPVEVVNDAVMQALGRYKGGRLLFLGLGTGLGSAFIADGMIESLEFQAKSGHAALPVCCRMKRALNANGEHKRGKAFDSHST
jgi:polyphosphate glucokinase